VITLALVLASAIPPSMQGETSRPASTPLEAAQRFLRTTIYNKNAIVSVQRQTSKYALIGYKNATVEGSDSPRQLLAERFPFGWQLLDISVDRILNTCQLRQRGVPASVVASFRSFVSVSRPGKALDCSLNFADVGSAKDVAAIRLQLAPQNLLISPVRAIRGYALASWFGSGGGESFFKKMKTGWKWIGGGGGAAAVSDLVSYGIPEPIAKDLLKGL